MLDYKCEVCGFECMSKFLLEQHEELQHVAKEETEEEVKDPNNGWRYDIY